MRFSCFGLFTLFVFTPSAAYADNPKVLTGAKPNWVIDVPTVAKSTSQPNALIEILYSDTQVRVLKAGHETYIAQRFKILRPEALSAASLKFVWRPSVGQATVHSATLVRKDGTSINQIGKTPFQIIQREENLEQSMLTGITTAVLPIPGVEVGDEIEFSVTIAERDPTFGEKNFGVVQLPLIELPGQFRARILNANNPLHQTHISTDLATFVASPKENRNDLIVSMENPKSANIPEGAPGRFAIGRLLEFSGFSGWTDVSRSFWSLFQTASQLPSGSTLHKEIANIAQSHSDQSSRALAALKLVQDRVRYVYVGLGSGNYTPATAEETWERRYGDCKGKTALLLSVLKGLGIQAEAVLVNQSGMDGISGRLPSPGSFDHVLVRAIVDGKAYWLDGTLFNSPTLDNIPLPAFRSALPLRNPGSDLETVAASPPERPFLLEIIDIDASAGTTQPAKVTVQKTVHGNDVNQLRTGLASLAGDDLKRALNDITRYQDGEAIDTNWSYDDNSGALTLKWSGTAKLDWEGDEPVDQTFYIPGAGFTPPTELKRPKEQDQTAPWAVEYPYFKCWITTIRLPSSAAKHQWTYMSKPVDRVLGGIRYYRQATLKSGTVQTIMSKRALQPELSTAEAKLISDALPDFDNAQSYIYQQQVGRDVGVSDDPRALLDRETITWRSTGKLCQP
jgi:hypothetical protein